jgi:acetyl esterase/lipase
VALLLAVWARAAGETARFDRVLQAGLGPHFLDELPPQRRAAATAPVRASEWLRPLRHDLSGITTVADVAYGEHGERNRLDVLRPAGPIVPGRPVLLHMHGGGYAWGRKNLSALPLLHRLARSGWVVVTINYRLVPAARWPAPLVDAKRAVAWIREHIAEHGGDPRFIAATGGSAGGNLSLLLATTAGQSRYQPGFEQADTRIQAAVPVYAGLEDYDFSRTDDLLVRHTRENVMPPEEREDPEAMGATLPTRNLSPDAPPVLVVTGTLDALAIVEGAREYVAKLQAVSRAPVLLAEVQGGFHGFDDVRSLRTLSVARGVHQFLECVFARARLGTSR